MDDEEPNKQDRIHIILEFDLGIKETIPPHEATNVPVGTDIEIIFDEEDPERDPKGYSFYMECDDITIPYTKETTPSSLIIRPSIDLPFGSRCRPEMHNAMLYYSWRFYTEK